MERNEVKRKEEFEDYYWNRRNRRFEKGVWYHYQLV